MNTLIDTTSNYLQHSAFTALFFDAWLKSLAVLGVAGGEYPFGNPGSGRGINLRRKGLGESLGARGSPRCP